MSRFQFVKSSFSSTTNNTDCVEVATNVAGTVAVRDSKWDGGPVVELSDAAWAVFLGAARSRTAR
ncbi:DUF397 domain-containing protein [Streptomyces sp. NPDC046876]|uniref:DUF397 domain-containing protein n=1 Tax=Streptomyces sp. NPDC046876 TaxID=3155616 RepID=UPI0033EA5451